MNYYIESKSSDPRYNLALEQFVFDSMDRGRSYFLLWQNDKSIIIGKNQNAAAEINASFVNAHNIKTVRRLSGGGAVYHDLGNLNFTFITDANIDNSIDLKIFCIHIQKILISLGVSAEISGRNDITVDGYKISGNAQYVKQGRVMHHGTLLYDSDLEMLSKALNVSDEKIESKGIKSVRSRVANIRKFMRNNLLLDEFKTELKNHFFAELNLCEYNLSPNETAEVERLKELVYSQWSWNFGASPSYNIRKTRKIENCGSIEVLLDIEKNGVIKNIAFFGDFFGNSDPAQLADIIKNRRYEYNELSELLKDVDLTRYFNNLNNKVFLDILFN